MSVEAIELQPIRVDVAARVGALERNGFYERSARGFGRQFTRQRIEALNPTEISDVVRQVPGVRLRTQLRGQVPEKWFAINPRVSSLLRGPCVLDVYIDGVRMADPNLDQIPEHMVEAIEVYAGVDTPLQYQDASPCGVVLMWTR
jgi:hypothetical protein